MQCCNKLANVNWSNMQLFWKFVRSLCNFLPSLDYSCIYFCKDFVVQFFTGFYLTSAICYFFLYVKCLWITSTVNCIITFIVLCPLQCVLLSKKLQTQPHPNPLKSLTCKVCYLCDLSLPGCVEHRMFCRSISPTYYVLFQSNQDLWVFQAAYL